MASDDGSARGSRDSLTRRPAQREPKARFTLFCEGEKTEPAYFKALRALYDAAIVDIRIVAPAGAPISIVDRAVEARARLNQDQKRKAHLNSFEERDQIWAVFDRDDHDHYKEAVQRAEKNRIGVARSNPCFEVWLMLHIRDYDKSDGRHALQAMLKKVQPGYNPDGHKWFDCTTIIRNLSMAERRAEMLLKRRELERSPYGAPSTTVHQLTAAVREAAEAASAGGETSSDRGSLSAGPRSGTAATPPRRRR